MTRYPQVLQPLLVSRIASLTPGAMYAALVVWLAINSQVPLVAVAIVPGAALMVRSWRAGVVLERDKITMRGFFWSRTVARSAVLGVNAFDFVVWRTRRGGTRWTPMFVFLTVRNPAFPGLPLGVTHNENQIGRVRSWVH